MPKRSKNYKEARNKIKDTEKAYSVKEAVEIIKSTAYAKFNETVELHINLGIDPKLNDQRIRFAASLPNGTGKTIKILVISNDNSGEKGNVNFRDEKVIEEIMAGKIMPDKNFNVIIATTDMMKNLAKVAKILGPRGMMPSPKLGTVTDDVEKAINNLSKGQVEVKSQPNHAVIHQAVGKVNFDANKLAENIEFVVSEINKNSPSKLKKKLIQRVYLTSTMGPSVRISA
jgi:large subunit ribosomal protein L1